MCQVLNRVGFSTLANLLQTVIFASGKHYLPAFICSNLAKFTFQFNLKVYHSIVTISATTVHRNLFLPSSYPIITVKINLSLRQSKLTVDKASSLAIAVYLKPNYRGNRFKQRSATEIDYTLKPSHKRQIKGW